MTQEAIIAAIRTLTDYGGVRLKDIEEQLHIPRNTLSGMLNGSRKFNEKYQKLLVLYLEARSKGNSVITIPVITTTPEAPKKPEPSPLPKDPITKAPPPGMTKAQQIRWHRESNQTLL